MLGINYKKIESNGVGNKTEYAMQSLDFEEFLWAKEYDETFVEDLLSHLNNLKPFSKTEMNVFSSLFMDFCILGGMPKVVATYIERKTFEGTLEIQKELKIGRASCRERV